jgi:cytochrome b561
MQSRLAAGERRIGMFRPSEAAEAKGHSMHSMTETKIARYDAIAMTIHWVTAVLMIVLILFGEDLIKQPRGAAPDAAVSGQPSLHVSLGIAVLILTVLRLVWRLMNPPPPYPAAMKPWEVLVSRIMHALFYILMVGVPITGWLAFAGYLGKHPALSATTVFGLFPVPAAPAALGGLGELHELGSNLAMVLVILHVLAALKHQFIDRDTIMRRMLPH